MKVMLYKHPGPHDIHRDKFDYITVEEDGVKKALKDGWCRTPAEAKERSEKGKKGRKCACDNDGQAAGGDPAAPGVNKASKG